MFVNIALDVSDASPADAKVLRALAEAIDPTESGAVIQMADRKAEQEKAQETPETPEPARRTRRTRKAAAEPVAAAADADDDSSSDDGDADDSDLIGGDDPTLDDAVARAKELVQNGKGAVVRAALKGTGASRVKDLEGDDIATFLDTVKEA